MNDILWTRGGRRGAGAQLQPPCAVSHRASFLPVELSTVDLMNVRGPDYRWSTRWWSLVCFWTWAPPFLLASTKRHSRDRCSQALHVFHHSSTSVYHTERKTKNKKKEGEGGRGRGAGNKASIEIHWKENLIYIYIGCVYQVINILHVALSTSAMYACTYKYFRMTGSMF